MLGIPVMGDVQDAMTEPTHRRAIRWAITGAPVAGFIAFGVSSLSIAGIISVWWALGNLAVGWVVLVGGTWLEEPLRKKGPRWHIGLTSAAAIVGTIICVLLGKYEIQWINDHAPPPPAPPYVNARLPTAISMFMESNSVDGIAIDDCDALDLTGPYFGKFQYKYFDRVSYDFRTNALFISYYLPAHPVLAHDDNMLRMLGVIASQTENQVAVGKQFFNSKFSGSADRMSSQDFKFTGRVYVYLDELMEETVRAKLESDFREKGLFAEFRDPAFSQSQQIAMIAAQMPSLPEYKIAEDRIEQIPGTGSHAKYAGMQKAVWRATLDPSGEHCTSQLPSTALETQP